MKYGARETPPPLENQKFVISLFDDAIVGLLAILTLFEHFWYSGEGGRYLDGREGARFVSIF